MLDSAFCDFLEYRICDLLENSNDDRLRGFWCDGILLPPFENCYSQKYVNDNRQVILKAYIGKNEQQEYELTMNFGPKALSKYARNLDIQECVPNAGDENCFAIDIEKFKMELQLL